MVSRRRLAGEEECTRFYFRVGMLSQPVIDYDDPECIQQLPLVFVDALDLAVEDGVRVNALARRRLQPIGKLRFGL